MSIYDITIWYQICDHPEDALPLPHTSSIRCSQEANHLSPQIRWPELLGCNLYANQRSGTKVSGFCNWQSTYNLIIVLLEKHVYKDQIVLFCCSGCLFCWQCPHMIPLPKIFFFHVLKSTIFSDSLRQKALGTPCTGCHGNFLIKQQNQVLIIWSTFWALSIASEDISQ